MKVSRSNPGRIGEQDRADVQVTERVGILCRPLAVSVEGKKFHLITRSDSLGETVCVRERRDAIALLRLLRIRLIDLDLLTGNEVNALSGFEPDRVHPVERDGTGRIHDDFGSSLQQDKAPQR